MSFDQARREVISACLELAEKGYLAGTGGNVALRIGEDHFAITPSATDYYAMHPEDICVLRINDLVCVAGDRKPSVELRLHANVFRTRRDCNASIHTHQPIASAYTLLGRALAVSNPRLKAILGPKAEFVNYAPSGTNWLAAKLGKALKPDINAYLMRNHGVVCCGPTLQETVNRLEALEVACADFFRNEINGRTKSNAEPSSAEVLRLLTSFV